MLVGKVATKQSSLWPPVIPIISVTCPGREIQESGSLGCDSVSHSRRHPEELQEVGPRGQEEWGKNLESEATDRIYKDRIRETTGQIQERGGGGVWGWAGLGRWSERGRREGSDHPLQVALEVSQPQQPDPGLLGSQE